MNYLLQRGKLRSQVINVPEGLPELLSDITREALRCQPTTECLCQFIIDYLHSVIVTRDKARMAKLVIDRALRTVDEVVADMCICDIDKEKSELMSVAMEECFQKFLAQRRCERGQKVRLVKFNDFDMLDELIHKCRFSESELKTSRPVIEAAYQKFVDAYMAAQENTEGTEALYQYFREREMQRIEIQKRLTAAVRIQSTFRGFLARRSILQSKDVPKPTEEITDQSENMEELEEAARKIQRFFRRTLSVMPKGDKDLTGEKGDECKPDSNVSLTIYPPGHTPAKEAIGEYKTEEHVPLQQAEAAQPEPQQDTEIKQTEQVAPEAQVVQEEVPPHAEPAETVPAETAEPALAETAEPAPAENAPEEKAEEEKPPEENAEE